MRTDRRTFVRTAAAAAAGILIAPGSKTYSSPIPKERGKSVFGLKTKPMDIIRVGFIGIGARGAGHVAHALVIEGVEVKAICDLLPDRIEYVTKLCRDAGRPEPDTYGKNDYDYRNMLERNDIDIVYISTPWRWHVPMCVDTMNSGKHAFVEVPAATTLEDSWKLVDTAEKTQKNCMMLENTCYGREELMVLNMCRQGIFGELTHGEGAYIHDLRDQMLETRWEGPWRVPYHAKHNGNLYPTHGLGPIAQYMNINRGDKFDYLTSLSSPALGMAKYAKENLPPDNKYNQMKFICGDMNTSLIKTAKGRSIMIQHDTTSPRPYSRINLISGTNGTFRGYPGRVAITGRGEGTHEWQDIEQCYRDFEHPLWSRMAAEAAKYGGHGGMDFIMNWRVMYCLRNGEPLDQDVYDAAAWSAVFPLSEKSVADRSNSVDYPDFTRGRWKTNEPLGIIK